MKITVREWVKKYQNGEFSGPFQTDDSCFEVMVKAGWYDWFCDTKELPERLDKFAAILSRIDNDFLLDHFYICFNNNCPFYGPLYDDMRFEPLDEEQRDQLYFVVSTDDEREDDKLCVYTARKEYQKEVGFDQVEQLIRWLNSFGKESQSEALRRTEDTQKALDHLCAALQEMSVNDPNSNHVIGLKLIERVGCKDMFGNPLQNGKYVRVIWSDNPDRNDGYYDVCVDACSAWGTFLSVVESLKKKF